MLSYELAKSLKDAGFPQEPKPHSEQTFVFEDDGGDGGSFYMICPAKEGGCCAVNFWRPSTYEQYLQAASDPVSPANNPPEVVKVPTLSELIEACLETRGESDGRYSFYLESRIIEKDGMLERLWRASEDMDWRQADAELGETSIEEFGSTPEKAVAKLWLTLKQWNTNAQ